MDKKKLYNKIMGSVSKQVKTVLNEGLPLEKYQKAIDNIDYIFDLDDLLKDKNNLKCLNNVPLRLIASGAGFGGPFMLNEKCEFELLEKSPSRTYSIEEVTKLARQKLGLDYGWIKSMVFANNVETCILIFNKFDNRDFVIEGMKAFGWSFAYEENGIWDIYNLKALHFDPMFQDVVNEEIKTCSILHHWTPTYNYPNIIKNGLEPRSNNYKFSYPPKIHLIKGSANDIIIMNIGKELCNENKDSRNTRDYVLLDVNVKNLLDKIDFFYDPRYEFGYYTKQSIDKKYIKKNREYHF